uniref:Association with the SNF1 complex (ASC) domain-containing protein n=1 Tax=Lotharella oceanica TaxID=641309 RepID=A0A7S2TSV4_9EUKA|mmetsp:Transcript_26511/g.49550  ORF Transcript_26511/g.49550 Transcript_26511/m.49550 type:complete len:296 (+) Transcript_26511:153-1040(+)|eukprot:CAMPEP_0170179758 /NCGR_PEP_ID=MMETSP0040_2-20121228/19089_1 /TAXON_ID=641309 /ORGANISM="Lotharella oceanica, Strain CCMP622" /LENGTH=295 /DNA_ID=CAMNT_0010424045 /DNA_START=68 /DNA_END=958 /DNA_ORIENTATION=-
MGTTGSTETGTPGIGRESVAGNDGLGGQEAGHSALGASPRTLTDRIRALLPGPQDEVQKKVVPTQFRWPYGGRSVYIAGSFNDWKGKVPMEAEAPSEGNMEGGTDGGTPIFTITLDLPPGTHYYKFIVDDQWQYDPAKDRMINLQGVVNNVIKVKPRRLTAGVLAPSKLDQIMGDPEKYGQEAPHPSDFSADPPPLPPQLSHLHLNAEGSSTVGAPAAAETTSEGRSSVSEPPLHVTLNHMCFRQPPQPPTASSNVLVIGVTQRYRAKDLPNSKDRFVTTVYYKPKPAPDVKMQQ